jgi:hypothetical protein
MLEHKQQVARKKHAEKKEKQHARGKAMWREGKASLTMIGLGFLTNIVMAISHRVV